MDKNEIALELTLCAIQNNIISKRYKQSNTDEGVEQDNEYAAKQVADFYNNLLNNINL